MGERAFPTFVATGKATEESISNMDQRQILAKAFQNWGKGFKNYSTKNNLWKIATDNFADLCFSVYYVLIKKDFNSDSVEKLNELFLEMAQIAGRCNGMLSVQDKLKNNYKILEAVLNDLSNVPRIGKPLKVYIENRNEYKEDKESMAQILSANTNKSGLCLLCKELLTDNYKFKEVRNLREKILKGNSKRQKDIVKKFFPKGTDKNKLKNNIKENKFLIEKLCDESLNKKIGEYGDLFGLLKRTYKVVKQFNSTDDVKYAVKYIMSHS